jgi:hypothetical protein
MRHAPEMKTWPCRGPHSGKASIAGAIRPAPDAKPYVIYPANFNREAFGTFIYAAQPPAIAESGEEALRAFLDPMIRRDPALAGELA